MIAVCAVCGPVRKVVLLGLLAPLLMLACTHFGTARAGAALSPQGHTVEAADLPTLSPELWYRFMPQAATRQGPPRAPGRLPVGSSADVWALYMEDTPWRSLTYESIYASQKSLAQAVFSLARHAGDVPQTLQAARFYAGVQGYHYSVAQVCAWLDSTEVELALPSAAVASPAAAKTPQAMPLGTLPPEAVQAATALALQLEADGVVRRTARGWKSTGLVRHVLGAASGRKRSLCVNLAHERWHVRWDEDPTMREQATAAWEALPAEQRLAVRESLRGYSVTTEVMLEEWAVRREEGQTTACRP